MLCDLARGTEFITKTLASLSFWLQSSLDMPLLSSLPFYLKLSRNFLCYFLVHINSCVTHFTVTWLFGIFQCTSNSSNKFFFVMNVLFKRPTVLLRNLNFCKSLLVALWRYPLDKFCKEIWNLQRIFWQQWYMENNI